MNPKKLARRLMPVKAIRAAEESYRLARNRAVSLRYGQPARGLRVIAVTGTNGKTTTCSFINAMLKAAGFSTAMFTTAEIEVGGQRRANTTGRTVLLTGELFNLLRQAQAAKADFVVLEATSQALHQHKLRGIPIMVAVMTNLTQEHLDYHKTMTAYAAAKARLFNTYMKPAACVLNRDDEWYDYFAPQAVGQTISYGRHPASSLRIKNVVSNANGSRVRASYKGKDITFTTKLVGEFNVYNAAAALATGLALGLEPAKLTKGLGGLQLVPGRMQAVAAGQPFKVLIDYAVTPDALKQALTAVRAMTKGRVSLVFGATGDRDKTKRPVMGRVAAELADKIYLTDDETYTEDPAVIRQAVFTGIQQAGGAKKTEVIDDRAVAIEAALAAARPGDTVLITGIGHQTFRNMGGKKVPWNEAAIARRLLTNGEEPPAGPYSDGRRA
jgi:UDP-N-acetylmuramoyl-L-alanyl-D-glutamate--2,6-diaminopimelate ligase